MATFAGNDIEDRVAEKMEHIVPHLDGIEGARRMLLMECVRDWCRVAVQLEDVDAAVDETGTTLVNKQGNVVKNPDLTVQHTLRSDKTNMLVKLMKFLPEDGAEDALAAFMQA